MPASLFFFHTLLFSFDHLLSPMVCPCHVQELSGTLANAKLRNVIDYEPRHKLQMPQDAHVRCVAREGRNPWQIDDPLSSLLPLYFSFPFFVN